MSSQGEGQAIMRNPPAIAAGTGAVDARYVNKQLSLAAGVASAATQILTGAAGTGCFVTFVNPGVDVIRIGFGTSSVGSATSAGYPLLPGAKEEWWIVLETHFSALCANNAELNWYRSSN